MLEEKLDDVFFVDTSELDSPVFYLDAELKQPVDESQLQAGTQYYFTVLLQVQNTVKNQAQDFQETWFPHMLTTGTGQPLMTKVLYWQLNNQKYGYETEITGSFIAQNTNTFVYSLETTSKLGTVIVQESNYDNNSHTHTFTSQGCSENADLNNDGTVDIRDFAILSREFLTQKTRYEADINCDNMVDIRDYAILARSFSVNQ